MIFGPMKSRRASARPRSVTAMRNDDSLEKTLTVGCGEELHRHGLFGEVGRLRAYLREVQGVQAEALEGFVWQPLRDEGPEKGLDGVGVDGVFGEVSLPDRLRRRADDEMPRGLYRKV